MDKVSEKRMSRSVRATRVECFPPERFLFTLTAVLECEHCTALLLYGSLGVVNEVSCMKCRFGYLLVLVTVAVVVTVVLIVFSLAGTHDVDMRRDWGLLWKEKQKMGGISSLF